MSWPGLTAADRVKLSQNFHQRGMTLKLSKQDRKTHEQALALLNSGKSLTFDDAEFVHRHLRPDATTDIGKGSAFFTPWEIAADFQIETRSSERCPIKVLDLCAGFGILSHQKFLRMRAYGNPLPEVTCIEINPEYVEIGRKLFPEAEWICIDVLDVDRVLAGRRFDEFYSNPPFGAISKPSWGDRPGRKPVRWEYAVAEIGMRYAEHGTMICQQGITSWKMSGCQSFVEVDNPVYKKWSGESGLVLANNCGIDCSHTPFKGANVTVDICVVERTEKPKRSDVVEPASESEIDGKPDLVKRVERTLF